MSDIDRPEERTKDNDHQKLSCNKNSTTASQTCRPTVCRCKITYVPCGVIYKMFITQMGHLYIQTAAARHVAQLVIDSAAAPSSS